MSAFFKVYVDSTAGGPMTFEVGRERIRLTGFSTGPSGSVSVHGRVPQQYCPFYLLN